IPANDNPTKFFFHFVLPAFLISFFIYGIFPVICLKCHLVEVKEEDKKRLYSEISKGNSSIRQSMRRQGSQDLTQDAGNAPNFGGGGNLGNSDIDLKIEEGQP